MLKTTYRRVSVAAVTVLLTTASACSSDSNASSGGELTGEVTVTAISNLTGTLSPYGKAEQVGYQLAVEHINESGMLGDATFKLETVDAATDVQQAVNAMSKAVQSNSVAVISPEYSTEVLSMAPIAQQSKIPLVVLEAGVDGIVDTGEYVFRTTPPQVTYIGATASCLGAKDVGTVGLIYADANATMKTLVGTALPKAFDENGIEIVASEGYPDGTTDFASIVTKVLSRKPDAVGVITSAADIASIISQLDRQDYDGQIFGQAGMNGDLLTPVAEEAVGAVWSTTFAPQAAQADDAPESMKTFLEAWHEKYPDTQPTNFEAEAWDQAMLIAQGLERAGSTDRSKLQAAIEEITKEGFDGALGHLTFENRDARLADPVLLEWDGKAPQLAGAPCDA